MQLTNQLETGYNRLSEALLYLFQTHQKSSKTLKIWLSYGQISEKSAKWVDLEEYYHKYVNSSPNLAFLGSIWSYYLWQ